MAERGGLQLSVADLDLSAIVFAREGRVEEAVGVALRVEEPSLRMLYALADMARSSLLFLLRCASVSRTRIALSVLAQLRARGAACCAGYRTAKLQPPRCPPADTLFSRSRTPRLNPPTHPPVWTCAIL